MSIILGIDIGGSGIKGALVDTTTGQLCTERLRIATPRGARPADVTGVVRQIVEHFGYGGPVGITFPGVVQGGVTLSAANVDAAWVGLDADALLTRETGQPVHLLNDADAAGLAEMRFGAGLQARGTVLVLTFGTGIGSALIRNGELVPNTELGHLWLRGKHAETWASARARDEESLGWKAWGARVTAYLRHVEALFSPDLLIIGGGISKKADKWGPHVSVERSRLMPAALQNDAGIVGAALYTAAFAPAPAPDAPAKAAPRKARAKAAPVAAAPATAAGAGTPAPSVGARKPAAGASKASQQGASPAKTSKAKASKANASPAGASQPEAQPGATAPAPAKAGPGRRSGGR